MYEVGGFRIPVQFACKAAPPTCKSSQLLYSYHKHSSKIVFVGTLPLSDYSVNGPQFSVSRVIINLPQSQGDQVKILLETVESLP